MRWTCGAVFALALAGCSELICGDCYLIDGGPGGADGGRDGATIDAGNDVPPIGSGVGLSSYRPLLGETLRAIVGPTHDPMGAVVTTELEWTRDGDVVGTGQSLLLDRTMFAAGDEIQVELRVSARGVSVVADRAVATIEADDTTRWRRLLPPRRAADLGFTAFDAARQRLLLWAASSTGDASLWEMQLAPSGTPRWVELHPTGAPPEATVGAVIYDRNRNRVLNIGGVGEGDTISNRTWALSLESRGEEAWAELTITGVPNEPPARAFPSVVVTGDGERAFIYGGASALTPDLVLLDDLWEVELRTLTFTRRSEGDGTAKIIASLIHDEARDRLLVIGGAVGMDLVTSTEIEIVDLSVDPATSTAHPTPLSAPIAGGAAVSDGERAWISMGVTTVGVSRNTDVLQIDLETLDVTRTSDPDRPQHDYGLAFSRSPFSDRVVLLAGDLFVGSADAWEVDLEAGSFVPITGTMVDLPPPSAQAMATITGGATTIIGGYRFGLGEEFEAWRLAGDGSWTAVELAPAADGNTPDLRYGVLFDGSESGDVGRVMYAFGNTPGVLPGDPPIAPPFDDVWQSGGDAWEHLTVLDTSPMPPPRVNHMVFRPCSGRGAFAQPSIMAVFGGNDGFAVYNDTHLLFCDLAGFDPPLNCVWRNIVVPGSEPSPRTNASISMAGLAAGERDRYAILFGGSRPFAPLSNEFFVLDACASTVAEVSWVLADVTSPMRPSARTGHTSSHVPAPAGAADDVPSTIVIFGGEAPVPGGTELPNDVWRVTPEAVGTGTFELTAEPIEVVGAPPPGRRDHSAVWDPTQDRLVIYGGGGAVGTQLDDAWELRIRD